METNNFSKMSVPLIIFLCFIFVNIECKSLNGYIVNNSSGIGYKIMFKSQTWPAARDSCVDEGGKLAVPKTQDDFQFIQKLVRGMYYPNVTDSEYKPLVWLGVNNLDDYRVWKTIDGLDLKDAGFNKWVDGNGKGFSDAVEEPHCAGVDPINPGLRDYWCHRRQPYMCQADALPVQRSARRSFWWWW
ncbi:hemolymph lipopolysaccharide-binding protein-like [Epargyreus clarus]|uniref:hemolymph lipopolysaccharide-binding protein-like n=1 Tax=Epargyreus clarus TaxID=520877 RepID=UPI003C2CE5EA